MFGEPVGKPACLRYRHGAFRMSLNPAMIAYGALTSSIYVTVTTTASSASKNQLIFEPENLIRLLMIIFSFKLKQVILPVWYIVMHPLGRYLSLEV